MVACSFILAHTHARAHTRMHVVAVCVAATHQNVDACKEKGGEEGRDNGAKLPELTSCVRLSQCFLLDLIVVEAVRRA